jgi:hypothetical protein
MQSPEVGSWVLQGGMQEQSEYDLGGPELVDFLGQSWLVLRAWFVF